MKKRIMLFMLIAAMLFSAVACEEHGYGYVDVDVDYNFSGCTEDVLYTTLLAISNNYEDYKGKTVAISGKYSYLYDFEKSEFVSDVIIAMDPTNCCDTYFEIQFAEGISAVPGAFTTFIGTFMDSECILVTETVNYTESSKYDIDARLMSASDIKQTITDYNSNCTTSDLNGKKVMLVGHHTIYNVDETGMRYKYLTGLDNYYEAWSIELGEIAEGLSLPVQNGNYLNPVVITGTLSFYTENQSGGPATYACINVETIARVYPKQ